ncbi:MAG TPA: AMP-binding protein, partial [Verrucomicrobiae bacterium]|nr:AMP-binding protein [Verrucomicrobiae bacterium]
MRARIETNETYSEFFEKTAARLPSSIAAETGGSRLTYEELSLKARQLAAHLRSLGVGPESLVAICLERSLDFLAAVLAIWKAGGAYLPLDVSYPGERLEYMLTDSRAECLITRRGYLPRFGEKHPRAILVDDAGERARWESLPPFSGPSGAGADSLAYVIYTSGSTGLPKGVEITHRSLLNHNFSMAEIFQLEPKDRVLQFAPFSFDLSVEEIFPTWL